MPLFFILVVGFLFCLKFGYVILGKNGLSVPLLTKIKVGDETIGFNEINKQKQLISGFWAYSKYSTDSASLENNAEDTLITQKIIAQEAQKLGISVSGDEINKETDKRASVVGGKENQNKILASYHWTETDLKSQVYSQLLEQKIRDAKEVRFHIQSISFTTNDIQKPLVKLEANKLKEELNAGKNFDVIKNESINFVAGTSIIARYFDGNISGKDTLTISTDQELVDLYHSLKIGEAKVFINKTGIIFLVYKKSGQNGVFFEDWLLQMKSVLVKKNSIFSLRLNLVKDAYATKDPYGKTCGGISFCASDQNDCGANNYSFCSSGTAPGCSTSGFPVCCIQTSPVGGTVKDVTSGKAIPGATVTGISIHQTCSSNQYNNNSGTTDSFGNFWLGWYNCNDNAFTITPSATGYTAVGTYVVNKNTSVDSSGSYTGSFNISVDNISNWNIALTMTNNTVPLPKYGCNAGSCIQLANTATVFTYDSTCGGTCSGSNSCALVTLTLSVSPNPSSTGSTPVFSMTGSQAPACAGLDPGTGVPGTGQFWNRPSCGGTNANGKTDSWNCTVVNTPGTYTATFSHRVSANPDCTGGTLCTATKSYIVSNSCSHTTCGGVCSGTCGQQTCTDQCGDHTIIGSCSCQTCPPAGLSLIYPNNNSTRLPRSLTLLWANPNDWGYSCSGGSRSFDLYFGTSSMPPICGTGNSLCSSFPAGYNLTSYPVSDLAHGITYYWRVVAKNGSASTLSSPTWNFTIMNRAWFQVVGGDISGGGSVTSNVPNTCVNPSCSPYIIKQSP